MMRKLVVSFVAAGLSAVVSTGPMDELLPRPKSFFAAGGSR